MKLWPRPKTDKQKTVGVKLLQMMLFEVERRGVSADQLERVVGLALDAEKKKQAHVKQRQSQDDEYKEETGDEMEGVEGDFSEMVIRQKGT